MNLMNYEYISSSKVIYCQISVVINYPSVKLRIVVTDYHLPMFYLQNY